MSQRPVIPLWDLLQSLDETSRRFSGGVDAQGASPLGPDQPRPRRRNHSAGSSTPGAATPTTDAPDPEEVAPDEDEKASSNGARRRGCPRARARGACAGSDLGQQPLDIPSIIRAIVTPLAQNFSPEATRNGGECSNGGGGGGSSSGTFSPPIDIFTSPSSYTLHAALPGAKKEDIGVRWDPRTSELIVSGVVHRPGDEAFLKTLTNAERTVGHFERSVVLGGGRGGETAGGGDEVDAEGIAARMEDGVLVVVVPRVEREWTEVRRVDID